MRNKLNKKPAHRQCSASIRATTAWLLVAGFLLQPVLAYLVTPILTQDDQGQRIVICTLKGERQITVDLPPISDHADSEHCSALKLYQIASAVQITEPVIPPAATLYAVELLDQTADHQHHALHFSSYSTRAPPAFS